MRVECGLWRMEEREKKGEEEIGKAKDKGKGKGEEEKEKRQGCLKRGYGRKREEEQTE